MIDWYRNETWNHDTERMFFDKLKKTRSQKVQYLKIQAFHLLASYPEVTLQLIQYARNNCPDEFWEQEFCLYESKALYAQGKQDEAIIKAYESVEWHIKKTGIKTDVPYWISELVLKTDSRENYERCIEILVNLHSVTPFPMTEFYYHGYYSLLLARLGKNQQAKVEAQKALSWASKDENNLQNMRKRKYGIFKAKTSWPLSEIEKIAHKNA